MKAQGGAIGIGLLAQLAKGVVFKLRGALVVVVNTQLVTKAVVAGYGLGAVGAFDFTDATTGVIAVIAVMTGFVFAAEQLLRSVKVAGQAAH